MLVTKGPHVLQVAEGVLGVGLKLAGTAFTSGEASGLGTTAKLVTFDTDGQLWAERKPVQMRMRAVGQTLTIGLGEQASGQILAADTFTAWLPCTALFLGKDSWWVTGGAAAALEYEVQYV